MLHPSHFEVDEAWIAFRLNDVPICTERDGEFNILALMDAASCFILGSEFYPAGESEPSAKGVRLLLRKGRSHKQRFPKTLFVAKEQVADTIAREATREKIDVVRVPEIEFLIFTGEAREGFKQHIEGRA